MIPKVDHYIGQKLIGILPANSGEQCQWAIQFDGGVLIRNYSETMDTPPQDPTGQSLLSVDYDTTNTTLNFGNLNADGSPNVVASIALVANEYTIAAPDIDEIDPRADHDPPTPDDPSGDRVVSGPT